MLPPDEEMLNDPPFHVARLKMKQRTVSKLDNSSSVYYHNKRRLGDEAWLSSDWTIVEASY